MLNGDKWDIFKKDFESSGIPCFVSSYLDKQEVVSEVFMTLVRELSRDQNVQKFENEIWQMDANYKEKAKPKK